MSESVELVLIIEHLQYVCRGNLIFSIYKTFVLLILKGSVQISRSRVLLPFIAGAPFFLV